MIPQQYREYEPQPGQVENSVSAESPQGPDKIVILGRARNLDIQERSDRWYVDDTFKIVPLIFGQLFVVLAEEHGAVHPCAYGLLPNKDRVTNHRFFDMLLNLRPNMNPSSVSCDYEAAVFGCISQRFPNADIDGCFFHFVKNFIKHIGINHLKQRYDTDANFALEARMIPAIAFVPIARLNAAFATPFFRKFATQFQSIRTPPPQKKL